MGPRVRLLSGVMFVLSWPSQQPSTALIRDPSLACHGPLEGCGHTALCILPLQTTLTQRREKKSKGWGGKEKDEKQRDLMPGVLVAFHEGASIPAPLEGKRRGGWRVGVHSSLLMPWRGVDFGCGTRNEGSPKPLQTRRPGLANALFAYQKARQRGLWVHHFPLAQRSDWPEGLSGSSLSLSLDVLYKTNLDCENKSVIVRKARKQQGESVDRKHVLLWTELNSFELFGESQCQSSQGRKGLFHIFHRCCSFSPWLACRQAAGWHGHCNFQLCPFSKRLRDLCSMSLLGQFSQIGNIISLNIFQPHQKEKKKGFLESNPSRHGEKSIIM